MHMALNGLLVVLALGLGTLMTVSQASEGFLPALRLLRDPTDCDCD